MFRNIASTANPRRTTLAHLEDLGSADELRPAPAEHPLTLPEQTANPRRTVLVDAPQA
ncbi:hypothetical protein SRB5_23360 [Streptomyces sp. RB5]|uniref:Uncharacterized protein n=1 Tax=Streptomyces smaragdinus TaxID=2585196 RepID=A0A7K0CFQ3_9ACTN|nr:hypothetical protein [Streptomyces smaragdinus]MQY12203.1 hypothetical protein [Streptomyces smaragdinus]